MSTLGQAKMHALHLTAEAQRILFFDLGLRVHGGESASAAGLLPSWTFRYGAQKLGPDGPSEATERICWTSFQWSFGFVILWQ